MRIESGDCRERMAEEPVARLATTGHDLRPHIVPITFALIDREHIVTAVDQKPKSTLDLRRLRNIADNPNVAVLCDHYADDWSQLWWVRADGTAAVVESGPARDTAVTALSTKYPQYQEAPPHGPAILVKVTSWAGWAYSA